MKQLFAIVLASAALTVLAAEPTKPAEPAKVEAPKTEMKLAKKRADKEAEAKAAKDATKSQTAQKAETTKK